MDHQTPHISRNVVTGTVTFHAHHTTAPGGVIVCRDVHGTMYSQFKADHDRIGCPAEWEVTEAALIAATGTHREPLAGARRRLVGLPR